MWNLAARDALAPLVLRLGLAVIFIFHGLEKVNEKTDWGATWANRMPNPPSAEVQRAVAWGELSGGIALGIGLLTRVAALGIAAIMAGAIVTVTGKNGFSVLQHGYEYNFAILIMCAAVFLLGGGTFALDRLFWRWRRRAA